MNTKDNMTYWDDIEDICYETVRQIAACSTKEFDVDPDELEEVIWDEIGPQVRDLIIQRLSEIGGEFPFVDEDY